MLLLSICSQLLFLIVKTILKITEQCLSFWSNTIEKLNRAKSVQPEHDKKKVFQPQYKEWNAYDFKSRWMIWNFRIYITKGWLKVSFKLSSYIIQSFNSRTIRYFQIPYPFSKFFSSLHKKNENYKD